MIAGLAALALSGCASVAVNENGGVIEGVATAKGGLQRADAACAKSGRSAKATGYDGFTNVLTFECVARNPS